MFAFSVEKIDFLIFAYLNVRVHLKALITSGGYIGSRSGKFVFIVELKIRVSYFFDLGFISRHIFDKFKVPKRTFGTASLQPYKTVNSHSKVPINSSF